jgi:hypothetical protein
MLHEYKKKTTIKAEQFDGSNEMIEKYGLQEFGWKGFIKVPNSKKNFSFDAPMILEKGDWFIENDKGEIDVLSDEFFRRNYERCD